MRRFLVLVSMCLFGACQSSNTNKYVTRDEIRDLLAMPPAEGEPGLGSAERQQKLELMVGETLAAPDAGTRAAAALTAAGERTARLADAIKAIDQSYGVCATNLANLETTAYKGSYAIREPGGGAVFRINFEQGSMENTGRPLDLGIQGQGFFKVKVQDTIGDGFAYTRNGNFFVNQKGELVLGMGDGYRVEPKIMVPKGATDVSISQDGIVEITSQASKVRAGQLQLAQFMNPQGLNALGGSLYTETVMSGFPVVSRVGENGAGQVLQGFLETSNVDAQRERLRMRFLTNWRNTILKVIDEMK